MTDWNPAVQEGWDYKGVWGNSSIRKKYSDRWFVQILFREWRDDGVINLEAWFGDPDEAKSWMRKEIAKWK